MLQMQQIKTNIVVAQIILAPIQHLTHSHTMTPFDAPGKQAF